MAYSVRNHIRALTKVYPWIKTPILVGAPMRVFAGPALAAAVTRAGGIGFMGPGAKPTDLEGALIDAREILQPSFPALDQHDVPLPVGVGFQTFDSDLSIASEAIKRHNPVAVWLFAPRNGQTELDTWSRTIREVAPGIQVWIQVGSVIDALTAMRSDFPPDVLVLQGSDAGGHGLAKGAGFVSILPEVADELKDRNIHVPLMAAGGIADGRGVAAALTLGAVGVVMGTRFLASKEANISKGYQDDVLRIKDGGQNTVRTTLYDELAGRTDWPSIFDGRNIVNKSILDHREGIDFQENRKLYKQATAMGDSGWGINGRLTAYVGASVGLVRSVEEAEEIVNVSRRDAADILRTISASIEA